MSYELFAYYYDSLMEPEFYNDYYAFIKMHAKFTSVLELGCGTGEIAIRLAKDKRIVYATDLSKDMLEVARLKAMEADVDFLLGRVDMTDFSVNSKVDLVLCLCDSLNYVTTKKGVRDTFKNCYRSLKKGGTFIFDVDSIYKMDKILDGYQEESDDEDFYFKWTAQKTAPGKVKHHVEIIDKEEQEHVQEIHIQQTYPLQEYNEMLKKIGFNNIEIFSDFDTYYEDCHRVIFVCRKEK